MRRSADTVELASGAGSTGIPSVRFSGQVRVASRVHCLPRLWVRPVVLEVSTSQRLLDVSLVARKLCAPFVPGCAVCRPAIRRRWRFSVQRRASTRPLRACLASHLHETKPVRCANHYIGSGTQLLAIQRLHWPQEVLGLIRDGVVPMERVPGIDRSPSLTGPYAQRSATRRTPRAPKY